MDTNNSANIIFLLALKKMGIENINMENVHVSLVRFSGEHLLPVYAEQINQMVKFMVVDCPLKYNVIFGRRLIHPMKAVPSTYHQVI